MRFSECATVRRAAKIKTHCAKQWHRHKDAATGSTTMCTKWPPQLLSSAGGGVPVLLEAGVVDTGTAALEVAEILDELPAAAALEALPVAAFCCSFSVKMARMSSKLSVLALARSLFERRLAAFSCRLREIFWVASSFFAAWSCATISAKLAGMVAAQLSNSLSQGMATEPKCPFPDQRTPDAVIHMDKFSMADARMVLTP